MLAFLGVSFLTPIDGLFVLAAALPLAVLLHTEQRAEQIRRLLRISGPSRRNVIPVVVSLVLLPALIAVAAAQPVVVRQQLVNERADAQGIMLIDTSLSMSASGGFGEPTRIERAKRLAIRLQHALSDVPMGVASMTDRSLPNVLPTTDRTLFERTIDQSVQIDSPPPSQLYKGRATTWDALIPLVESHFYTQGVQRRLLIILTDGEATKISPLLEATIERKVAPVFVHVWEPGERIYHAGGKVDPKYFADPTSTAALNEVARITGGQAYPETDFGAIVRAARNAVGRAGAQAHVGAYARVALAPWFVLSGILPLGFLLWRRNF